MVKKKSDKMYHFSKEQRNPQVGCGFDCVYCAFRKLMHRFSECPECNTFTPHYHIERLNKAPKRTEGEEFISLCLNGDISFASAEFIERVIKYCEQWHDRRFLIQSKNPARLLRFKFPYNVILGCYAMDVRAVTPSGFKSYKELKEGDTVFTLNPDTKKIECAKVEKMYVYNYCGEMFRFKGRRLNVLVTPNHNMVIHNRSQKRKILLSQARDVAKLALFHIPKGTWDIKTEDTQMMVGNMPVDMADIAYLIGIFIGDGCQDIPKTRHVRKDGTIKVSRSSRIFLCIPDNDKARQRVIDTLSRCRINYHLHKKVIYFSSIDWYNLFVLCGNGVKNKTIPRFLLEKDVSVLNALYEGIMDSDGHENRQLVTTSLSLIPCFSELCAKIGKFVHIRETKTPIQRLPENRVVHNTTAYRVSVSDTEFTLRRHNVSLEEYEGVVWCCSVGENRNLLVESNGTVFFCGNSTIETNYRSIGKDNIPYSQISKAPHPEERHRSIRQIHNNDVHITIEPIMDFHPDELVGWMRDIPMLKVINIGYDSRPELNHLPEPHFKKVEELISRLEPVAEVRRKMIRPAWWEQV